jgi:hypothetical protein
MKGRTPLLHASAAARWGTMSIAEQLAHVGSEVERVLRAHEAGKTARRDHALARAAAPRGAPGARAVLHVALRTARTLDSAQGMRRYVLAFAVLSRRNRP